MKARTKNNITVVIVSLSLLFQTQLALAATAKLPSATRVYIETRQDLIGKGDQVHEGQSVRAQVWKDVVVNGQVLIAAGTQVIAKIDQYKQRQIAGVKGSMTIGAYETESVDGQVIQLSGGYHKDGKSRMALSITLGVLFILPIFIPGKAAELPSGTVFDSYINGSWNVEMGDKASAKKVDLSYMGADISAALLYEKFEETEKPKYFEFQITVPEASATGFVIDRVNSESIKPIKLNNISETNVDEELIINSQVKIKTLLKQFAKGINTIEISIMDSDERVATKMVVDIEI